MTQEEWKTGWVSVLLSSTLGRASTCLAIAKMNQLVELPPAVRRCGRGDATVASPGWIQVCGGTAHTAKGQIGRAHV